MDEKIFKLLNTLIISGGIVGVVGAGGYYAYKMVKEYLAKQQVQQVATSLGKSTSEIDKLLASILRQATSGNSDLNWYEDPAIWLKLGNELGLTGDDALSFVGDSLSSLWDSIWGTSKSDPTAWIDDLSDDDLLLLGNYGSSWGF